MQRMLGILVVAASVAFFAGCGAAKNIGGTGAKDTLADLGDMLKMVANEKRKPPTKLAELGPVEPLIPLAGPQIRSGEIVYLWGTEYAEGSNKIAAHEKKTPTEGGWVLLQDGTVKEMTADEFKAASKGK